MAHSMRVGTPLVVAVMVAGACSRSEQSGSSGSSTAAADSAALAAEGKPTELQVSNVMIGRQIGPGGRITEPTFQFAPQDTVFVSVATEGGDGSGRLTAAWRSQNGEILATTSELVRPAGENNEFRFSQPKGLKPGTYKVIIFLGEDSVETRVFAVKK